MSATTKVPTVKLFAIKRIPCIAEDTGASAVDIRNWMEGKVQPSHAQLAHLFNGLWRATAALLGGDAAEPVKCPSNQYKLLRQRRILARHLLKKNQVIAGRDRSLDIVLRRSLDLQVELDAANARADETRDRLAATSEKLGETLAAKLATEGRLEGAEQVCDSLRADLERAYTYRTDAIARAISAEARAAQAERMLTTLACRTAPSHPSLTQRIATFFGRTAQEIPA